MVRLLRILACALAVVALVPAMAHASNVREYQLQYSPVVDGTQSLLIVTAIVDPAASLPTSVTVPVPAGATLMWSGEVLGGAAEADPFREASVESVGGMDLYTFTVSESRLAQVEVYLGPATISGSRVEGGMVWINPGDEVPVSASVVAEPGAADLKATPAVSGEVQTNSLGETLHPLGGTRLPAGGSYAIEVSWRRGGAGDGDGAVLPILLGALAIAVVALIVVLARERTKVRRAASAE
ncbi:MAG: hypothetical protein ISP10_04845 [Aeromicrobium sp.]|nr:hypothetical protein [Aeromicrobium sp.]